MEVEFIVKSCDETEFIHVDELVTRLTRYFPDLAVDRERGTAHVDEGFQRLVDMAAPQVILDSHKSYYGNVVHVSISGTEWDGAVVSGFLYSMRPQLGDRVSLEIQGSTPPTTFQTIATQLEAALDMELLDCEN